MLLALGRQRHRQDFRASLLLFHIHIKALLQKQGFVLYTATKGARKLQTESIFLNAHCE